MSNAPPRPELPKGFIPPFRAAVSSDIERCVVEDATEDAIDWDCFEWASCIAYALNVVYGDAANAPAPSAPPAPPEEGEPCDERSTP